MPRMNGHSKQQRDRTHGFDATSSVMSSDIDTTSFFDSEDDASSRSVSDRLSTRPAATTGLAEVLDEQEILVLQNVFKSRVRLMCHIKEYTGSQVRV